MNTNKDKNPLVSVIIPVFNTGNYISDTLDSIIKQDYANIEVIVVDDGSTDGSGAICDDFANRFSNLHIYHQRNQGVTVARAYGLKMSQGNWIVFVDGDDQLLPGAITFYVNKAIETNADIIQTPLIRCEHNGARHMMHMRAKGAFDKRGYLRLLSRQYITNGIGGRMIRRSLFDDKTFDIPTSITNNEDLIMNYHLSDNLKQIYCAPQKGFYLYIARGGSASNNYIKGNWIELYSLYDKMASTYGDAVYVSWVLSVYERFVHNDLSNEECKELMRIIPIKESYPLFILTEMLYVSRPCLVTKIIHKVFASLDYKIHPVK